MTSIHPVVVGLQQLPVIIKIEIKGGEAEEDESCEGTYMRTQITSL